MTKQDAIKAILKIASVDCDYTITGIKSATPKVGRIYILEETADTPVRVVTCVENHLTKSAYDSVAKALTGSIYLFKVAKVDQYKYKDWDYNVTRVHTRSIDGELRYMAD